MDRTNYFYKNDIRYFVKFDYSKPTYLEKVGNIFDLIFMLISLHYKDEAFIAQFGIKCFQ